MAYIEGTDLRPTDKMRNIWGMPAISAPEFYRLPEIEKSLFDQAGGGGQPGWGNFRMNLQQAAPTGPLFAPDTLLNWGNGPVPPSVFLDQINADRGKLITKSDAGKFMQRPSTGEPEARRYWQAKQAEAAGAKINWTPGSKYGFGL
jgi:hypothetical protein